VTFSKVGETGLGAAASAEAIATPTSRTAILGKFNM
jgi:hypothetical protein